MTEPTRHGGDGEDVTEDAMEDPTKNAANDATKDATNDATKEGAGPVAAGTSWDRPGPVRERERRPPAAYGLLGLVLFQGLSGLAGGFGFMADPSGASMRIPLDWLQGSPFQSYLVPGIVLFTVLGLFPLFVSYGVARRRSWSWAGSLAVGLTLLGFLAVEILVVGFQLRPPLQPLYALVGLGIVLLAMAPSVRAWLRPTGSLPGQ